MTGKIEFEVQAAMERWVECGKMHSRIEEYGNKYGWEAYHDDAVTLAAYAISMPPTKKKKSRVKQEVAATLTAREAELAALKEDAEKWRAIERASQKESPAEFVTPDVWFALERLRSKAVRGYYQEAVEHTEKILALTQERDALKAERDALRAYAECAEGWEGDGECDWVGYLSAIAESIEKGRDQ